MNISQNKPPFSYFSSTRQEQPSAGQQQGGQLEPGEFDGRSIQSCKEIVFQKGISIGDTLSPFSKDIQKSILEYTIDQINERISPELQISLQFKPSQSEIYEELDAMRHDKFIANPKFLKGVKIKPEKILEQLRLNLEGVSYDVLEKYYKSQTDKNPLIKIINAAILTRNITAEKLVKCIQGAGYSMLVTNFLSPSLSSSGGLYATISSGGDRKRPSVYNTLPRPPSSISLDSIASKTEPSNQASSSLYNTREQRLQILQSIDARRQQQKTFSTTPPPPPRLPDDNSDSPKSST